MNKDVIVGSNGKQFQYAKANLGNFTYLGIDFDLLQVIRKILEESNHSIVKPVHQDLMQYVQVIKETKELVKPINYSSDFNLPKTLGDKMSPEDYAHETSHDLDKFLRLYDLIHEAKDLEEHVQEFVIKNKSLISQNKSFIQSIVKAKETMIRLEYDKQKFTGIARMDKAQDGYFSYSRNFYSKDVPELTKIFNSWLEKNKNNKLKIDDVLKLRQSNNYHTFLEIGFFNCFEALHLIAQKMPFGKIAQMEVFLQPRSSFALIAQKEFKFPEESSIYLVILENVNRVPSICYTKKVGSGNNTNVREVDLFSEATLFSNLQDAKEFCSRIYKSETTVVKFDIGMTSPEVIVGSNDNFTSKVEASFIKDKLVQVLGGSIEGSLKDVNAPAPRKHKI